MKALRYLLIAVTVLSVLSLSAQTRQYATTHSQEHAVYSGAYVNPQMPVATMDYRHSDYMKSGSTLPQAAVDGPTTTYDEGYKHHGQIRRAADKDDEDDPDTPPSDPPGPMEDPIGDAMIPLALLACAYLILRVVRRRAKGGRTA